jgi:hypothetical protein
MERNIEQGRFSRVNISYAYEFFFLHKLKKVY